MPDPAFIEERKREGRRLTYAPTPEVAKYMDNPRFRKLQEENQADTNIRKARWASLKEEFLERSITGKNIHWPTLATKYGFAPQSARNRASKDRWYDEIEKRAKERENLLDERMVERTQIALHNLQEDFATSEEYVRKRHVLFARSLQEKAIEGLRTRPLKDFKTRDLITLLELGLTEERKALGMKETADLPAAPDEEDVVRAGYKPIFDQIGNHQKVRQIGTLLLKEFMNAAQRNATDVVPRASEPSVQSVAPDIGIPTSTPSAYQPVPEARPRPKFTVRPAPKGA
jgi:hypothetical protein